VALAVTEIRQFGGSSMQVVRRMRALLEDLIPSLPAHRTLILQQELDLLKITIAHGFTIPEDRLRAEFPDSQGLGGTPKRFVTKRMTKPSGSSEATAATSCKG
jgi:hypothetical protein